MSDECSLLVKKILDPTILQTANDEMFSLPDDSLIKLYPHLRLLYEENDINVCYHGRECTVQMRHLYSTCHEGQNYYLVLHVDQEETDMVVTKITCNYDDAEEFLVNSFDILTPEEFSISRFVCGIQDMNVLIPFFKKVYGASAGAELHKHLDQLILSPGGLSSLSEIPEFPWPGGNVPTPST